jgi:hypothetical protein
MKAMIGCMSLSYDRVPKAAFRAPSLRRFGNQRWAPLKVALICAMLCWVGEAQARTCADLFNAIKSEAMYCGFFCDLVRLQLLQKAYETTCIRGALPPSLFDLDSVPQESSPFAGRSDLVDRTAILEGDVQRER